SAARPPSAAELVDEDARSTDEFEAETLADRLRHLPCLNSQRRRPSFHREVPARLRQRAVDAAAACLRQHRAAEEIHAGVAERRVRATHDAAVDLRAERTPGVAGRAVARELLTPLVLRKLRRAEARAAYVAGGAVVLPRLDEPHLDPRDRLARRRLHEGHPVLDRLEPRRLLVHHAELGERRGEVIVL